MIDPNQLHPQFITNAKGERTSVILPLSEYEDLLEDLHDLAICAERRDEPTVSHEELIDQLKRDRHI